MELINKTDANLNIALIAKNKAKSDAQKALMGRVLFMMDNMPIIEAIPKADYETRLKADMVAVLKELQLEIEEIETGGDAWELAIKDNCNAVIQQKINALNGKGEQWK